MENLDRLDELLEQMRALTLTLTEDTMKKMRPVRSEFAKLYAETFTDERYDEVSFDNYYDRARNGFVNASKDWSKNPTMPQRKDYLEDAYKNLQLISKLKKANLTENPQ